MDGTTGNCPNFSYAEINRLHTVNIVGSTASFVASFATIALVILTRSYHVFVHRLTAYLAVPVCLLSFAFLLHIGAMRIDGESVRFENTLCTTAGFLVQYITWVEIVVACWINIYVLELAIFGVQMNKRRHEVAGIVLCILLPLLLSWEPFVQNAYGPAGAWCWIKVGGDNCTSNSGLSYQMGFYYGPLVLLSALNVAEILFVTTKLCVGASKTEGNLQRYHIAAIKEVLPIFIYPGIFFLTFLFGLSHRISSALLLADGRPQNVAMWVTFVLVLSGKGLYLPLAFIFHPHVWRDVQCKGRRSAKHGVEAPIRNGSVSAVGTTDYVSASEPDSAPIHAIEIRVV